MVLVLSESQDINTNNILHWMQHYGIEYRRVNANDPGCRLLSYDSETDEWTFLINGETISSKAFDGYLYRRDALRRMFRNYASVRPQLNRLFMEESEHTYVHLGIEADTLCDFLYDSIEQNIPRRFGSHAADLNKMTVSRKAAALGLRIPKSRICDSKPSLTKLLEQPTGIITKAVSDGIYYFNEQHAYYSYTEQVTSDKLDELPERFFPSLLQDMIKKKFELRIFFLEDQFYTMAIFSQFEESASVDYRKLSKSQTLRKVPFAIPASVQAKLSELIRELGLNTGSIDMIVDDQDEYYFLEINPVGQIGMTSGPCNYQLEKKIAQYFIAAK